MKVIFSKYARQELDDATQYYEIEYQGLGKRFRDEVERPLRGFQNIQKHGQLNGVKSGNAYSISFHTSFSIPLKATISL